MIQKTMTIHFKDGRPPLTSVPYTEMNIRDYEKNLGEVIKEFKIDRTDEKILPTVKEAPKPTITLADLTPDIRHSLFKEYEKEWEAKLAKSVPVYANVTITDIMLVNELATRGKSADSISKFLGIKIAEVRAMLAHQPQK